MDYTPPASTLWSGLAPSPEKSCQILIREYPHRAIAIASSTHALILRHSPTTSEAIANGSLTSVASARPRSATNSENTASKCMVEFSPRLNKKLLADYRPLTPRPIYGTLGLIAIGRDVFLCVITQASRVATLRPGETVEKIEGVQFFCLNSAEYDDVYAVGDPYDLDPDAASAYAQSLSRRDLAVEHPCLELQKLLGNGTFFYSTDFDVTNRMQDRPADAVAFDIDNFDESFLWNSYMIRPLVEFRSRLQEQERDALDASRILTSAIRGFCKSWAIPQNSAPLRTANSGLPSYLTIVSRLSCKRAGTRFNSRGIDDDGHVANFVETETVYWSPSGVVFSYAQVRGSVPVFWEQQAGLIPGQQKITITRSADGTQPAFDKHFGDLEQAYGAVHVVNLLSASKPGELELTNLYRRGVRNCPLSRPAMGRSGDHALLRETEYDFHAETKGPQGYEAAREIRRYIRDSAEGFAYYLAQETDDMDDQPPSHGSSTPRQRRYVVVLQQEGVFRTNCLDCLDRTNLIQTIISQMAIESFLQHRGEHALSDFWSRHASLWADNGDSLSKTYAGTGALKSSFTRHGKMSLAGAIADVRKSATRLYVNNFADKARQNTIDTLLGRLIGQVPVILYDPISDYVSVELQRRSNEFSTIEKINIWVGTFNLNGRTDGINEDLSPWLCPPELESVQPEIVAVGFQEIVELNPQQIMNSDPTRKQLWEKAIKTTLDQHCERIGGERYVLLRSGQLVGAALCIFVKASALHNIKNVEGGVKKTGLSGMAGNKGAVAIRLDYANTPICFVTAHLAAGFTNYDERNKDYATIYRGLRFQRNRGIDDHDSVIWFGDFNYRIGLGLEEAKECVRQHDLEGLYANDQLNLQMVAGLAFRFYSEARITFMPTYKFDIGSDEYDSSEKARIPAWTDRILRKGTNLRQLCYNSAPLRFSDHRPVYATFECTVSIVNERLRDKISREIYERRKSEVGSDTANLAGAEDTDDEDLIGYDAIEPGLPPASSDRQKWWLDNGKMARSSVSPPKTGSSGINQTILNPKRPSNPYAPTEEPDWVNIPRSESRMSETFSNMSTSPYEHVNHSMLLSTSLTPNSSMPRKLPPPYDPSALPAKIGRMQISEESKNGHFDGPPPPPPPRRQTQNAAAAAAAVPATAGSGPRSGFGFDARSNPSSRSSSPTMSRKPVPPQTSSPILLPPPPPRPSSAASQKTMKSIKSGPPPVARKPAHLTTAPVSPSTSTTNISSTSTTSLHDGLNGLKQDINPELPRRSTANSMPLSKSANTTVQEAPPPPQPPRRTNTSTTSLVPAGGIGLVGLAGQYQQDRKPQLPVPGRKPVSIATAPVTNSPRKHAAPAPQKKAAQTQTLDLLDDDAGMGMEMGGWEALKPS
ncbi:SacI homology domain-containing protein [Diplogelasinospora grovesii]|uniref:phosphoinositide 5-phosphatase n=1 Tax=Diplogelasinospora grovesii TaxID=303347 RepID=A0AAN6S6Z7_9PEZI|nr:SacI homology domain-containing protein [Diplogelasinospora grovesii]